MRLRFGKLLPAVVGVIAGIGSSLYLDRGPAAPPSPAGPSAPRAASASEPAPARAPAPDQAARRFRALEARLAAARSSRDETATPAPPRTERERAEADRRIREAFTAAVQTHRDAPIDAAWSDATAASIASAFDDIAALGDHDVEVERVDCRSESCLAVLAFPSYGAARDAYAAYVASPYEVRCRRTSYLPLPDDASLPYRVDVLFRDCRR